jgi:hypothetical protein
MELTYKHNRMLQYNKIIIQDGKDWIEMSEVFPIGG